MQIQNRSAVVYNPYGYMNELYHYGVPGMKWGVRKNRQSVFKRLSDRRKRNKLKKEQAKKAKQQAEHEAYQKALIESAKSYNYADNDTLKKYVERMNLEKQVRDAQISKMNTAKQYVDMIVGYGTTVTNVYNTYAKLQNLSIDNYNTKNPNNRKTRVNLIGQSDPFSGKKDKKDDD